MENIKTTSKQKKILIVAILTSFITSFCGSALTLSVPAMGDYFHLGATSVGWIITIYTIVVAAFSVPLGKVADSTSRRTVLILGVIIFGVTSFIAVFLKVGWMMIAVRGIQSFGAAMLFAANMPIAIAAFPPQKRGYAIGIVTSGVYVGLSLGPVLGGIINQHFGWQGIFVFAGIISIIALYFTVKYVDKDTGNPGDGKQDIAGNILYIIMICLTIYGLTNLNNPMVGWPLVIGGLIVGFAFVKTELKAANPIIDVRIFAGNLTFTLSTSTALLHYSSTFALSYLVSIYLQVALGLSSQFAGFVLLSQPIFMALLSPRMGRLSDRIPAYKLVTAGLLMSAACLLFFGFTGMGTPVAAVCISLCIAGIGTALFSSPNTNVVMSCVHPSQYGVTNSLLSAIRTMGQSLSMAVITLIVATNVGNISLYEASPSDLLKTMHVAFFIFTGMCVLGAFMSLQRKKTPAAGKPGPGGPGGPQANNGGNN